MKNIFIPAIIAALTFSSVASNAQLLPPGIPVPSERNERKKDNSDRVKRDRDGRVINEDRRVYRNDRNLPPGQAKKVYGGKSAKVYAPGQRKKAGNGNYSNAPQRISIDDRYATRSSNGLLYYTDANGNVYVKGNDGYYHLESRNQVRSRNNKDWSDDDDDDRDDDHDYNKSRKGKNNKQHKNKKSK